MITAQFDRLNRPLTVDDGDAGTTRETTYAYALTKPSWTDPTGTYLVTLDRLDHATSVDGPAIAAITTAYRSNRSSQVLAEASTITGDPTNGTTTYAYEQGVL